MNFITEIDAIQQIVNRKPTNSAVEAALGVASQRANLGLESLADLLLAPSVYHERIIDFAAKVNSEMVGDKRVFYGVVYIHDFCVNQCTYCGDSCHIRRDNRRLLSKKEFINDVRLLLDRHPLTQICFLMGEHPGKFTTANLVEYLKEIRNIYSGKIILNIPPLELVQFQKIRRELRESQLQFRVFQETYDPATYKQHHLTGPKKDFLKRLKSQCRALYANFDTVGHGVLYGVNKKPNAAAFETLAMIAHARQIEQRFGKPSASFSFPRLLSVPGQINPSHGIEDQDFERCIAVAKIAMPKVDLILTCRETSTLRSRLRPLINIEDFQARPGPGGNSNSDAHLQMILPDMRKGEEVADEMKTQGYKVV